jgi:hypothetical protein
MRLFSFLFVLYFSLLSLAPNWQGIQLLNATAFIEHFQEHQSELKGWTLFSFVKEHYFNELDHSDKKHKELPLKTTVQVTAICFAEKFETPTPVVYANMELISDKNRNEGKMNSFISNDFHSIWQPPQLG